MNITPFQRPMLAPLMWLPAEPPCVYRRCRHRDHASGAPRTSLTNGEVVAGNRCGGTTNSELGLRMRRASIKSP